MRRQLSLWRLALASVGLLVFGLAVSAQPPTPTPTPTFKLHLADGELGAPGSPTTPTKRLPVLFVHGHNLDAADDPPNYRNNWQSKLVVLGNDLPSFQLTLRQADNAASLGIEEYYIQFLNQERSIVQDAIDIGNAVEIILHRHDPAYPTDRPTTNVQVVIIAYSKGTISSRLYLKSLQEQVEYLPPPRPGFRPISEFIAIAPPNHGLNSENGGTSCAGQQLMNGMNADCQAFSSPADCSPFPNNAPPGFFNRLNGHPGDITLRLDGADLLGSEAPGSRPALDDDDKPNPPTKGTLYVTLFANSNNPDFVGGLQPSTDCRGRKLAKNLSEDAENIQVAVTGLGEVLVHRRTVHTFEVMCKALYAAVHHRSPEGVNCLSRNVVSASGETFSVPLIEAPKRAAVMLTLDFSGSMSISTGPGANRASDLREAVRLFVELWGLVGVPSDRIGVNYFSTNVTPFPPSSNPVQPLSTNGPAIITDLPTHLPGGMTAMGNGLQQAIESLTSSAPDANFRRVILFTDGLQNVNPMARIANDQVTFVNESGRPNSNVSATAPASLGTDIAVDTIAVGDANLFVGELEAIAARTNGQSKTTLDMGLLRQFFIETLINALKDFSPQLVAYRRGTVAGKGSTEAFVIEDGVRKLVLKTSWKRGESLDFSVTKDGVDVTSAGRFTNADFYKIFVIDLPAKGPINARGNWQVQIKGNAGTAYEAAAIIDGSSIKYDSSFNLKQPRAGEPLDLVVGLTAGGQPISGTRVFVTLISPTMTAGDIIAEKPLKDPPAFEPGMSIGERQLLALSQDPKRLALLKPKSRKLVLEPNGKGEFRARLDTPVPGLYTAFITIEGNDPKLGQFTRTMTATTIVRFANPDRKATDILVIECDADAGRRYVRIFLSPRDTNRHFMGPGSAADVSLELSEGRMIGGARDLGDGSYALLLEVEPGNDPMVTLKVAGAALFSGRLSELRKFRQ